MASLLRSLLIAPQDSSMTDLSSMSGDLPSMGGDLPSMTDAQSTGREPTTARRVLMAGTIAALAGGFGSFSTVAMAAPSTTACSHANGHATSQSHDYKNGARYKPGYYHQEASQSVEERCEY